MSEYPSCPCPHKQ
ncbi:hypothetical protein DP091_17210 [Paenibacillus sp. MDMC362]|nr:hypothetical protein DP091_17210 [Paenibacillus sp. MDMC362]